MEVNAKTVSCKKCGATLEINSAWRAAQCTFCHSTIELEKDSTAAATKMFCKHCGNETTSDAVICTKCGRQINPLNAGNGHAEEAQKNKRGFAIASLIMGIFAAVAAIAPEGGWNGDEILGAIILSAIPVTLGSVSVKKDEGGRGMAVMGIILGVIVFAMAMEHLGK